MNEPIPNLVADLTPPWIYGTAELTHRAFGGASLEQLFAFVDRPASTLEKSAAHALDCSTIHQLAFQPLHALGLQMEAMELCQLYRVASTSVTTAPLRLLALMEPGDLMTNTPLDFITRTLNVQLDLLYLLPGQPMPASIPDHDIAYIGGGDIGAPEALARRNRLFHTWPRPVLNDPALVSELARDLLARNLAGAEGICSPRCAQFSRERLLAGIDTAYPVLIRPVGSHAGANLTKADGPEDLARYLEDVHTSEYYVTQFEDYRSPDGLFRKYRIAFIDREPFLCHMGVSANWMIHYLNAGMTGNEDKRLDEAQAMAGFDEGFANRHQRAFDRLNDRIGLEYYTIDCGETKDGRLLVFEADAEAIIHLMDPPDLFPYKQPQMERVFAAFHRMLLRRAVASQSPAITRNAA